ncbi:guanylate kinase [Desulfosediminicola flagellatus]|uniref:guanylate kinase n=1 Tax=Desulfosediminicola flagellatus TaxID=2569541 RepID=UPI0010AD0BBF|nr:guanylate kinase [Desulfosediminicola flagellatus]
MKKGILFVISAPSGTGKTTLLKKVMNRIPGLNFSVSHTTRKPRKGEQHAREYYFVETAEFERMIEQNQFIEWARVHDNYYGTSTKAVSEQLDEGRDIVLDIDVQGAAIIRDSDQLKAVQIFIAPPGIDELEKRLRGRNTEDEETLQLRLSNASKEMQSADLYEYLIVNDALDEAAETLASIIIAERSKRRRKINGEPFGMDQSE